jgi:hypothetical protein
MLARASFAAFALVLLAACSSGSETPPTTTSTGTGGSTTTSSTGGSGVDVDAFLHAPSSCAYHCPNDECPESAAPYACPALGAWDAIPHLDACPAWDGSYPKVVKGSCTATAPTGAALLRTGAHPSLPAGARVLPDGRVIRPAGSEWGFDEADQRGGTTAAVIGVPGTSFVLAVDTGNDDHAVRAIDTSLVGAQNPVAGYLRFSAPSYPLSGGIAFVPPGRVYVPTGYGKVQAISFDPATGALAVDDAATLEMPTVDWYSSSVAATPDGKRLVVGPALETKVLVYDIDPASPTYKSQLGEVDLGAKEAFGVFIDPADTTGSRAYVPVWGGKRVVEIDLSDPTTPKLSRTFATDPNPQGVAFLDARWMAVANDLGETISLIDRVTGDVHAVPVEVDAGLTGLDVSALAWDDTNKRLYATLAGVDAVAAYDVDLTATPPTLAPAGRLPTSWWPSGIVAHPDGSLTIVNMRGRAIGPYPNPPGVHDADDLMKGSVEHVPAPSAADLAAGEAQVSATIAVGAEVGYPKVDCPAGADDFPVPATNTSGPSKQIQHVFFIVRENKTFDTLLGDIPGVDGDASLMMKPTGAEMDTIWANLRDLARGFTTADNFYSLAVKSTQGHLWTTYGRATDACERTWSDDIRLPYCGVGDPGRPPEGSLFQWLTDSGTRYDILGEVVGGPSLPPGAPSPIDVSYPGGPFQNIEYNDLEKACYTAGRVRVACDVGSFVYMTLPNDHTVGLDPARPTPETMCAVNDEATGLFLDALSHSPLWASSLVVLTEDDPQQGGDHVDYHRTPLVLISPWVKRGYVTKTHIDVASLHKIFAHVLGLPYPNLPVKHAAIPFDAFTSTPDYTPYTYQPRLWPLTCGSDASAAEKKLTSSWDFSKLDAQPGLGDQVRRWMRGKQLQELPPQLAADVEARLWRKARGMEPVVEDDDDD